jgi:hypothetical protein
MKMNVREFTKEVEKSFGMMVVVVESTVEYPDIVNVMVLNDSNSFSDMVDWQCTYGLFSSTNAKSACVEASTCCF